MKSGFAFNGPDFRCVVRSGGGGGGEGCKSKHKLFIKTVQREEQKWASHLIYLIRLKVLKNEGCVRDFCVTYSVSKISNKNTHL